MSDPLTQDRDLPVSGLSRCQPDQLNVGTSQMPCPLPSDHSPLPAVAVAGGGQVVPDWEPMLCLALNSYAAFYNPMICVTTVQFLHMPHLPTLHCAFLHNVANGSCFSRVPTKNSSLEGISNLSICTGEEVPPSNDVVHHPMLTHAFGDIIFAADDEASPNPISAILEEESINVPVGSEDKLIPMLKMIKAVRAAGAPLGLLDTLVKIIKEEWQLVSITHERTVHEMITGAKQPSLTFSKFSFLGQLQDLLDDHVFSDLQNLVVDPDNRWDHYRSNSCPDSTYEIQDGRWFQSIVQKVHNYPSSDSIKNYIF
ncbi:hypothetical protein G9A89_000417 [Geosiphon pyriformis]|nr:hypothetical protein G9A89_000417 [Geosiphon pyriformis]